MSKSNMSEQEIIKNLADLKDLREAIHNMVKSGELMEKAMGPQLSFKRQLGTQQKPAAPSIPDEKPKMTGGKTAGLEYLGRKVHPSLGKIHYMYGIKGHKNHYTAEYDMKAQKNPWSVSHHDANTGSTLGRSPNVHSSKENAAADIAHHFSLGKWKQQ